MSLEPSAASACLQVGRARRRGVAQVRLRHHEHVGHLHDPRLQELKHVPRAWLHHHRDRVADLLDVGLGLARPRRSRPPRCRRRRRARRRPPASRRPARRGGRRPRWSGSAMPSSLGSCSMRARSPSSEPPERLRTGRPPARRRFARPPRHTATSADSSVDLPAPGGPVTPIRCAGASPPSAAGETSASRAPAASRPAGERSSIRFRAAGAAERSPSRRRRPSSTGSAAAMGGAR